MRVLFRRVAFLAPTLVAASAACLFVWKLQATQQVRAQDTFTFRAIVDQYILDLGRAPVLPDDLVKAGYIKAIPVGVDRKDFFEEQPKQPILPACSAAWSARLLDRSTRNSTIVMRVEAWWTPRRSRNSSLQRWIARFALALFHHVPQRPNARQKKESLGP